MKTEGASFQRLIRPDGERTAGMTPEGLRLFRPSFAITLGDFWLAEAVLWKSGESRAQTVERSQRGVGGAVAPPTSIPIRRLCRVKVGFSHEKPSCFAGLLILLAKSIPYKFGRPLVDRIRFLEKWRKPLFRHAEPRLRYAEKMFRFPNWQKFHQVWDPKGSRGRSESPTGCARRREIFCTCKNTG